MTRETVSFNPLSKSEQEQFNAALSDWPEMARFGKEGHCLPFKFNDVANFIRNDMIVYPDDVWIVTPPKCGTTWMQEIVWHIHTDVDLAKAQLNQFYRIPFLELGIIKPKHTMCEKPDFDKTEKNEENVLKFMSHSLDFVLSLKRPRIIKTHLPIELLPKKLLETGKVVYVGRHPKDACVSWFHHTSLQGFKLDFHYLAKMFKNGITMHSPIMPHMLEAWNLKENPNLYFTTYECMKKDLQKVVTEVASFMGKTLTDEQMNRLLDTVDIKSMRKNKFVNKETEIPGKGDRQFIRKGVVGDWKNHFSPESSAEWDQWIAVEFQGTGIQAAFDIE